MFGAYLEINLVNGKLYAGKGEWVKRHNNRRTRSLNPNSPDYNSHISYAYRKYGHQNFVPHTLCWFPTEQEAFDQEIAWIREYDLTDPTKGYNKTHGGISEGFHTDKTKAKIAVASFRHTCPDKVKEINRQRMRGNTIWRGRHHTEAAKKAIGDGHRGKPLSLEHREQLRISHIGGPGNPTKCSEETKSKISASLKGKTLKTHCKRGHALVPENCYANSRVCKLCGQIRRSLKKKPRAPRTYKHSVEAKRKISAANTQTHCRKGHPLVSGNLDIASNGRRRCSTCRRDYARQRYRNSVAH